MRTFLQTRTQPEPAAAEPAHREQGTPKTAGKPSPPETSGARLAHDFSRVRIHADGTPPRLIQTKLAIDQPGDEYEEEADRVAAQVAAASGSSKAGGAAPRISRVSGGTASHQTQTPASVDAVLAGSGDPLPPALRQEMERRFEYDFSRVRIHAGAAAGQSARELNAHAYVVGPDIVFGAGRFAPGTHEGRRLLAHELAHVVQQGGQPQRIQRDPDQDPFTVRVMADITMTEDPGKKEIVYAFRGKPWVTVKYKNRGDFNIELDRFGDFAKQILLRITSSVQVQATVDLDVEAEFAASRKSLDDTAIGYDFVFHGKVKVKDGALRHEFTAPIRRVVSDATSHPVSIEGLPEPDVTKHEEHWLPGEIKDTFPSFKNLADLRAYLAANPKRSFAIIRAKDGSYVARPVTGKEIRDLAERARANNFKPGNLENIDWYQNAYQMGEFQGLWIEGQEYDDLASMRDLFFSDPQEAGRGSGDQETECEVYEMGSIDTSLGISYGRKPLSHEEATKRWQEIDKLSEADALKLETSPGHQMFALHVRGVGKMHAIDHNYIFERGAFRKQLASIDAKGEDRDDWSNVAVYEMTFRLYFEAQLDREVDDPDFIAQLKKYRGVAFAYGTVHYNNVVEAGQKWAAGSFKKSAIGIRDFVSEDKKLTQWVLTCPSLPQRDLIQTLNTLDMMDDSLLYFNALHAPQFAVAIAAGGVGNGSVTLEGIRNKAFEVAKKMEDAEDSILKGDIIAIKQEGEFGDAVRKGVYKDYGYRLDPAAFPYKDKLPDSNAFSLEVMGGSRSSFGSLGEQMFATQLRKEVAEDRVWFWAKRIGMLVATVVLVVALNAAGAAIAGALFAEGTFGYLAVSALVVGTGLTATEYLQSKISGVDMTWGQLLESEVWNIMTAGLLGKLGFAFKDASTVARVGIIGSAAFGLGLARFLAQHKGPVTGEELIEFFIENAVMFAAMEAASALARPMTENAALWGRARRLGVKVQEIADFNLKVNNLMKDLGSYSVRPGEAVREQAKMEATVDQLLAEQQRLVTELKSKISTMGDAEQMVESEAAEELQRIKAAVEGMKRAKFLAELKLKPVGQSQSVFTFENAPEAIQKIKDFFPGSRVEPQSDGSLRLYLTGATDPIILTPVGAAGGAAAPPAGSAAGKIDINRATEKELATLPGIGKKLAKAIVDARDQAGGRFATVDDLLKVPGIGAKTLADLAPLVVAEDPPSIAQRQAELSRRQRALLDRAEKQGYTDKTLEDIGLSKVRPEQSTNPKTLDAAEEKIAAAEKKAGVKMDAAAKKALANVSKRLGADRASLQTGALSGVSDTQLGDALARVAGRKGLGADELRGVVWAHLKGVPIEKFMDMAQGFGIKARNFALETFGRMADGNVRNCERVLSDMSSTGDDWAGGMFALEVARYGYGIDQIDAFEVRIQGPGGVRDIDIVLKNGLRIELKNWSSWEYKTSLADASNPAKPGQFLKDVGNENYSPSVFDKHRYIFRYPAPETPANIKAYLRSQLELYIKGKISGPDAKALLDAFDAAKDLVTVSKARADGGIPDVPKIPQSLIVPVQPPPDDDKKKTPTPVQVPGQ